MTTKRQNYVINFLVFITLFCIYIFPIGIVESIFPYSKFIFTIVILFMYTFTIKKIKIRELLFILIILFFTIITRNLNYLLFINLIFLDKVLKYKDDMIYYLKNSNILYMCLFFTIIYSILFFGTGGRYAFTAIKEINQSGLSIFCLAMLLMNKNEKIGKMTLLFGLLTISRSYYLAFVIYILFKLKFIKKIFSNKKILKIINYTNITLVSSFILILLGLFFIYQYKIGNIYWGDNISNRLFNLLDYSNFFRFVAVINLVLLFKYIPIKLLFGITESEFIKFGSLVSNELNIPYKYIVPHNLFYSHLKIYGIFSIFETLYISVILKKVVNKDNCYIYISIVLYSIFLGAGLYSYWLYLTVFTLMLNGDVENESIINR